MFEKIKVLGVVAALALAPVAAGAVTVVSDGDSVTIGAGGTDREFVGAVVGAGGAGSWTVDFTATNDPLLANASATIGPIVAGTFTNLVMSWIRTADATVLASVGVSDPGASLGTTFASPSDLSQSLVLSWDGSLRGAGFDVEVAAVPIPAAGILLLGALGGLGVAARRRKKAA